jgi:hypothetical protein
MSRCHVRVYVLAILLALVLGAMLLLAACEVPGPAVFPKPTPTTTATQY